MNLQYTTESGNPMVVDLCLIDSGYNADSTYDFCARNMDWALPVKGSSNPMQSHYKFSTVNKTTSIAHGMNLVLVDGGKYKDMIASRLRKENGTGSWMVYKDCDMEYAKQVTAEHKVSVKSGQHKRLEWVIKTSHADNHYLDCEVYAMAAADTLGVRMLHLQGQKPEVAPVQQTEQYTPEENWIAQHEGKWI
jgi:phage terminase large subunit GpA-like protein